MPKAGFASLLPPYELVHSMRAGRERIWELETRRLAEASHWLSVISTQWDEALGRLKVFAERGGGSGTEWSMPKAGFASLLPPYELSRCTLRGYGLEPAW